jgi:hypothetical protein
VNDDHKRLASLGAVAFFCLLCLGTSRSTPSGGPLPIASASASSGGTWAPSSAAKVIGQGMRVDGRLDPFDPKLKEGIGHYDAYTVHIAKGDRVQVRVQPAGSAPAAPPTPDAGDADAGAGSLTFNVKVTLGGADIPFTESKAVEGGSTFAILTAPAEGDYQVTVSAVFHRGPETHPGFGSYTISVMPLE